MQLRNSGALASRPRHHHSGSRRIFPECGRAPRNTGNAPTLPNTCGTTDAQVTASSNNGGIRKALVVFLRRHDITPLQQLAAAVILSLEETMRGPNVRGPLLGIFGSVRSVQEYARPAIDVVFDLANTPPSDIPQILRAAVETAARRCPNQEFWHHIMHHSSEKPGLDELCDAIEIASTN